MAIEQKGEFVIIQNTSVKISEILSARPQSLVHMDYDGSILSRDFPKIIVTTRQGSQQFSYEIGDDAVRDDELRHLNEIIGSYLAKAEDGSGSTTINVTSSTGVNIVTNSNNVSISQENIHEAKGILTEMKHELNKVTNINQELKEDILSVVCDLESQITNEGKVKRYSFRSLLGITSDFASLSGLAVSLGQVLGYL